MLLKRYARGETSRRLLPINEARPAQNGQERGEEDAEDDGLGDKSDGVFDEALCLATQDVAPQRAEDHVLGVGQQLGKEHARNGGLGPV